MNLFVSLVLDTFLIKWEAVYGNQDDDDVPGSDAVDSEGWDVISSREHLVRSHCLAAGFNLEGKRVVGMQSCPYMYMLYCQVVMVS